MFNKKLLKSKYNFINYEKIYFFIAITFSAITLLSIFLPYQSGGFPCTGLDCSWMFALNQAIGQHLQFGKDIIFTFGPYASIYTKMYSPFTYNLMILGSVYLAISYLFALSIIFKRKPIWMVLYCILLITVMPSRDVLLLSFPLISFLAIDNILSNYSQKFMGWKEIFLSVVLFSPLGLLVLIKGTLILFVFYMICLTSFYLYLYKKYLSLVVILLIPFIACLLFWTIAGQHLTSLLPFLSSIYLIISGYSNSMNSYNTQYQEIIFYIFSGILCIISIYKLSQSALRKALLGLINLGFLFVSFKEAFVRHDEHALVAASSIFASAFLITFISEKTLTISMILASLTSYYIDSHYNMSIYNNLKNLNNFYISSFQNGFECLRNRPCYLDYKYIDSIKKIKSYASSSLQDLIGTSDIYSYDQAFLFVSNSSWDPRPVFQSYSAYSVRLEELNKLHLLSHKPPENIVFNVEPIDNRLPSLEDGLSWPVILNMYEPKLFKNDFLFLKKKPMSSFKSYNPVVNSYIVKLNQEIPIPQSTHPIYITVKIKNSFIGSFINLLYKTSILNIYIYLKDGETRKYRIIPGMAKAGFIISPLIENTADFASVYIGNDNKYVKSVKISSDEPFEWEDLFKVSFISIDKIDKVNKNAIYNSLNKPTKIRYRLKTRKCTGSIDELNGASPPPKNATISGILSVNGWLIASKNPAIIPKKTYVVLLGTKNDQWIIPTRKISRPDVGTYFKYKTLNDSGFTTETDVSNIDGYYNVFLGLKKTNTLKLCKPSNILGINLHIVNNNSPVHE